MDDLCLEEILSFLTIDVALMLKIGIGAYICGFLSNDHPVKLYKVAGALEKSPSLGW